jgi:hypothetical protein
VILASRVYSAAANKSQLGQTDCEQNRKYRTM